MFPIYLILSSLVPSFLAFEIIWYKIPSSRIIQTRSKQLDRSPLHILLLFLRVEEKNNEVKQNDPYLSLPRGKWYYWMECVDLLIYFTWVNWLSPTLRIFSLSIFMFNLSFHLLLGELMKYFWINVELECWHFWHKTPSADIEVEKTNQKISLRLETSKIKLTP